MEKTVSVVIPAYNAELFIEEAIKSCFAQTYRPLEIVVVDDGSTDSTVDKVNRLRDLVHNDKFDVEILKISENKGTSNALHVGFSEAKGDYVCWLSADDMLINREKTREQVLSMNMAKASWSYFRSFYTGPTLSRAAFAKPSYLPRLPTLDPMFIRDSELRLTMLLFRNPINGSSVMIRKKSIEAYGQFDSARNVDHDGDLWMRYSALNLRLAALKGAPVFYRIHAKQVSTNRKLRIHDSELTRIRMLSVLEKKGNLVRLIKKFTPCLIAILTDRTYLCRPFVSEFVLNHILDHSREFNRFFLKCVCKSLKDLKKQTNYLVLNKDKFQKDLASFMESYTFKEFENSFLRQ